MTLLLSGFRSKTKKMAHIIEDLPPGPLDVYRKKASFSWKDMLLFLEGEEICALKVNPNLTMTLTMTLNEVDVAASASVSKAVELSSHC